MSSIRIVTDAATTACVVARPTPSGPAACCTDVAGITFTAAAKKNALMAEYHRSNERKK